MPTEHESDALQAVENQQSVKHPWFSPCIIPRTVNASFTKYDVPQQGVTDTVAPISPLPMYFIHSFDQPFCADAHCACHAQRQEVVKLFVKIIEGHFELEQAAALIEENGKEHRA